jgi:mRNA interferase MazF
VSPDELNRHIRTVVIAPMTTKGRPYPTRIPVRHAGKDGQVVIDQIRTVDKIRLVKRVGALSRAQGLAVLDVLQRFFAP